MQYRYIPHTAIYLALLTQWYSVWNIIQNKRENTDLSIEILALVIGIQRMIWAAASLSQIHFKCQKPQRHITTLWYQREKWYTTICIFSQKHHFQDRASYLFLPSSMLSMVLNYLVLRFNRVSLFYLLLHRLLDDTSKKFQVFLWPYW